MKKSVLLLAFFLAVQTSFAQSPYLDSLKNALAHTVKPINRFSILVKIAENNLVFDGRLSDTSVHIELLHIAQALKSDSLLAITYNWIGSYMAFAKGENTAGLEYYFKAIPLAEKVHDKRRISSLYFDISLVYFVLQNYEEAVKNIRLGGENLPDTSSSMYRIMLMQYQRNMAQYYLKTNRYDSALHYAQALTETSKNLGSTAFTYSAFYLTGSIYDKLGDAEMAELYFKKAIAMELLIENNTNNLNFFDSYIHFLFNHHRTLEALQQARNEMILGENDDNNNIKLSAAKFMQQAFDSLHQTDSAYAYAKLTEALRTSIYSQDNVNKIQALAFHDQLRLIEDNAKKEEEVQQRKENLQYALITLGIIGFVTLYLLLSRRFITNTKLIEFLGVIALLIVFEFLNLLVHPFLEKSFPHSPVIILLILVCIAALLVPLHHRVEKWAIHRLVEKNKALRLAAARKTISQLESSTTSEA